MPTQIFKGTGGGLGGTIGGVLGGGMVGMTDIPHNVKTLVEYFVYVQNPNLPPEVLLALQGLAVFFANFVTFLVGVAMSVALAWVGAHFGQAAQNGAQPAVDEPGAEAAEKKVAPKPPSILG